MAKIPRLDPYLRLIYRFFEALYFLHILGRVRGPHQIKSLDFSTTLAVRRRFLKNLAFLCDYMKGGPSSTAVAVEDRAECNVFWLSSNDGASEDIRNFLESVITAAKNLHKLAQDQKIQAEEALTRRCVTFASRRAKNQAQGLNNSARTCRQFVTAHLTDQEGLGEWLRQFEHSGHLDIPTVCQKAYEARKDPQMDSLLELGGETGAGRNVPDKTALAFRKTRHSIGRLAQHIRAVKEVVGDGTHLETLLDVFEVAQVPRQASIPRLPTDDHTTLSGILYRMFGSSEKERYSELLFYFSRQDQQIRLESRIRDQFDPLKSHPVVHAEIQMLHHFHESRRIFFADDPYIATSKPACMCCKLYFRHHPAGYEEPESHEKVYPNWGPIQLPRGKNDPGWLAHRKLLSKVVEDIRKEVLKEVERRSSSHLYGEHPDTLTALTASSHTLGDSSSDSQDDEYHEVNERLSDIEFESDSEGGVHL